MLAATAATGLPPMAPSQADIDLFMDVVRNP